jgi:starch synthase
MTGEGERSMRKVLFVSSEIFPLIKTGGLADFSYSLPLHLKKLGWDPVVLVPGYQQLMRHFPKAKRLGVIELADSPFKTQLLQAKVPGTQLRLWIVDTPELYDRAGGPYSDENDLPWVDNDQRFCHFCRVASYLALQAGEDKSLPDWQPDVVHCNDWQTGLIPAFMQGEKNRPVTVFTVHNLGYQGNFPQASLYELNLPQNWWSFEQLEFHGQLSFIKGGLVHADYITTVSPTYAEEILQPEKGFGLDGLLRHRKEHLRGILNGVDYKCWNPGSDQYIDMQYSVKTLNDKVKNKLGFQKKHHLTKGKAQLMVGFIGRLAYQKGIELLLTVIEQTIEEKIQWVILGSGEKGYQDALLDLRDRYPEQIFVSFDYNEELAHKIEASADLFLMPSYYEPCGLNQMYSMKYGTVPLVSDTGGLADTVVHASRAAIANGTATGFRFIAGDSASLLESLQSAIKCFRNKKIWKALQISGMARNFDWKTAAQAYIDLYESVESDSTALEKEPPCTLGTDLNKKPAEESLLV